MATRFYDEMLKRKIQDWVNNDHPIKVLGTDEVERLFAIQSDENNDKPLELPFIALSRDSTIEIQSYGKQPLSYDGMLLDANSKKSKKINAIPISIGYQVDIFTRHWIDADEIARGLTFNFINRPKITIELPYNGFNIKMNAFVRLGQSIEDNSDIPQRLVPGQFTRFTLNLALDGYYYSVPVVDNVSIGDIIVKVQDDTSSEEISIN